MYYASRENKGAYKLRSYCEADLRFFVRLGQNQVSHDGAQFICFIIYILYVTNFICCEPSHLSIINFKNENLVIFLYFPITKTCPSNIQRIFSTEKNENYTGFRFDIFNIFA